MPTSKPPAHLPLLNDVTVDKNIIAALPQGACVIATTQHGESDWTCPVRLDVKLQDGIRKSYFLKIASSDIGRSMLYGEFESMRMFYAISPDFVIRPLAWGTCASAAETHFFLSEFHNMSEDPPEVGLFCAKVADLHAKSVVMHQQKSCQPPPEGMYGFHVTTHLGMLPQDNRWCDTWEEFYIQGMKRILAFEEKTQGPSDELDVLARGLIEKVIPRLLRPLETGGRQIKPTLVHGDLQIRNARTDLDSNLPVVFDAGAFWAHNEYDIGKWRPARFKMGDPYMVEYHKHIPKSAPVEDWEDRNILYSMALNDMRYLVEKYPNGLSLESS